MDFNRLCRARGIYHPPPVLTTNNQLLPPFAPVEDKQTTVNPSYVSRLHLTDAKSTSSNNSRIASRRVISSVDQIKSPMMRGSEASVQQVDQSEEDNQSAKGGAKDENDESKHGLQLAEVLAITINFMFYVIFSPTDSIVGYTINFKTFV